MKIDTIKLTLKKADEFKKDDTIIKIILFESIKNNESEIKYSKIAKKKDILKAFEKYKKENNLSELTKEDKIKILKYMNHTDEEIDIILQHN